MVSSSVERHAGQSHPEGFTLVELSVVIAIIGILISTVIVGTSMVRQASIQKLVQQLGQYRDQFKAFTNQYGAPPGDLATATNLFGTTYIGTTLVNGNGDGQVAVTESPQVWVHLGAAGYIQNAYLGTISTAGAADPIVLPTSTQLGNVVPLSYFAGVTVYPSYHAVGTTLGLIAVASSITGLNNGFMVGNPNALSGTLATGTTFANTSGFLTPTELQSIDIKIDDANPRSGRVWAVGATTALTGCMNNTDTTNAPSTNGSTYTIANTAKACYLWYAVD